MFACPLICTLVLGPFPASDLASMKLHGLVTGAQRFYRGEDSDGSGWEYREVVWDTKNLDGRWVAEIRTHYQGDHYSTRWLSAGPDGLFEYMPRLLSGRCPRLESPPERIAAPLKQGESRTWWSPWRGQTSGDPAPDTSKWGETVTYSIEGMPIDTKVTAGDFQTWRVAGRAVSHSGKVRTWREGVAENVGTVYFKSEDGNRELVLFEAGRLADDAAIVKQAKSRQINHRDLALGSRSRYFLSSKSKQVREASPADGWQKVAWNDVNLLDAKDLAAMAGREGVLERNLMLGDSEWFGALAILAAESIGARTTAKSKPEVVVRAAERGRQNIDAVVWANLPGSGGWGKVRYRVERTADGLKPVHIEIVR